MENSTSMTLCYTYFQLIYMQISQDKKDLSASASQQLRQALTADQCLVCALLFPHQSVHANRYIGPVCMLYINCRAARN